MKKFTLALTAAALLGVALPAAAQSYGGGYGSPQPTYGQPSYGQTGYGQPTYDQGGYGYDRDGRGDFRAQLDRLSGRVRHEVDEGDLNAWQGRRLMAQIGDLRQLERRYRYSGGYLDGRERMELQARLGQLKDQVRRLHDPRGSYDRSGYDRGGYGQPASGDDEDYWNADRGDRGPRR